MVLPGLASGVIYAQTPALDLPLTVTDGVTNQELRFGIDPTATDGFDNALSESELPPVPPAGVFDARFIGTDISKPLGQGTLKDYRTGTAVGDTTHTYEISYQLGSGTAITIGWDLPMGITGVLQDLFGGVLVNQPMIDQSNFTVPNPAIDKLKMIITYTKPTAIPPSPPALTSPADGAVGLPTSLTLSWSELSEATSYHLQVSTTSSFATMVIDQSGIPQTSYPVSGLLNNTTYYWRVSATNAGGASGWSSAWRFTTLVTAVKEKGEITPTKYYLSSNFPNPLRPSELNASTEISYDLSQPGEVKIEIFNLLGNHVRTLVHQLHAAGRYSIYWDGRNQAGKIVPSGIYIYRLTAGGFTQSRRLLLLR
jgi:hypothetical protein